MNAFRRAHRRREEETDRGWVWALLCINRWPLKVALCHNTLAPTTPAAGKCHRRLLSAIQPARFSRQLSIPHLQTQTTTSLDWIFALWFFKGQKLLPFLFPYGTTECRFLNVSFLSAFYGKKYHYISSCVCLLYSHSLETLKETFLLLL